MHQLLAAVRKDLRRFSKDPVALIFWLGLPVLIGGLMLLAFGTRGAPTPQVQLLIADEDDSFGSRLLVGAFGQGLAGEIVHAEKVDQTAGRKRLDRGDASALLVIPKGFGAAVLLEEPTRLQLVTNPAQRILPGIAEEMLRLLSEAVFYLHRLVGPELRQILHTTPNSAGHVSDDDVIRNSVAINQVMRQVRSYLFPPVIELETTIEKALAKKPGEPTSLAVWFLPGTLLMALLFAAQGLSNDVWKERELGTLRRLVTTPLGVARFLVGKLLASVVVIAGLALLILTAGMVYLELPWARLPLAAVWAVGAGVLLMLLMLAIQVFASTHRGASFLSFLLIFPLFMVGGSMFPFDVMPKWMSAVGRWTPNGWAVDQLTAILLGRDGPLPLGLAFAVLLVLAAALFTVCHVRMDRAFARR